MCITVGLTVDGLTIDGLIIDGLTIDGLTVDGHDNWCSNTAVLMFAALCPRSRCMSIVSSS